MKRPLVLLAIAAALVSGSAALAVASTGGSHKTQLPKAFPVIPPVVQRSKAQLVPTSVAIVDITWSTAGHGGRVTRRVTSPGPVKTLSTLVNALPEEGPGTCAEGYVEGPPFITFAFRDARGRLLARAQTINSVEHPSAYCVPTFFSRPDRSAIRVEDGGAYLLKARALLHERLR